MKRQTFAETVADIVIGPESSDVLVPRSKMLKIGFGRGIFRGMVTSCSIPCVIYFDLFMVIHIEIIRKKQGESEKSQFVFCYYVTRYFVTKSDRQSPEV